VFELRIACQAPPAAASRLIDFIHCLWPILALALPSGWEERHKIDSLVLELGSHRGLAPGGRRFQKTHGYVIIY
jgi:hypothetical protein